MLSFCFSGLGVLLEGVVLFFLGGGVFVLVVFEELLKGVLGFLFSIFVLFLVFEGVGFCYLLVLLYIGGFFTLVVFVTSLHYVCFSKTMKTFFILLFPLFLTFSFSVGVQMQPFVFWVFLDFSGMAVLYFFVLLLGVFLLLSLVFIGGKSARNLYLVCI